MFRNVSVTVVGLALIVVSMAALVSGDEGPEKLSSAPLVQHVMRSSGVEAAVAKLQQLLSDSSDAYTFEYGHLRFAANWLAMNGRRTESLAMLSQMAELFPESPAPWIELAHEHIQSADEMAAETCLDNALSRDPDDPLVAWHRQHLSELIALQSATNALPADPSIGIATGITDPYFGTLEPADRPEIFAPGYVNSLINEFSLAFSPDMREMYFSRSVSGIMATRWTKEGWTFPRRLVPVENTPLCDEPSVSPDGRWLFFNVHTASIGDRVVYRAPRNGERWGEPESLFVGMYATAASDGTVYYTETTGRPDFGVIAKREPTAAGYTEPEVLGGGVNSERLDAHPYIAPDESFIIFDSNRSGANVGYICFRGADGAWGEAIPFNELLSIPDNVGQFSLTPDGRYLFFSLNNDMYWVSAEPLMTLRPE